MTPARAALGSEQVVPAVPFVEMWRLGESQRRACEDSLPFPTQALLIGPTLGLQSLDGHGHFTCRNRRARHVDPLGFLVLGLQPGWRSLTQCCFREAPIPKSPNNLRSVSVQSPSRDGDGMGIASGLNAL